MTERVVQDRPVGFLASSDARQRAQWKLLAMVAVLSLPVAVAVWAYWQGTTRGQLEWGELLHPARAVGALKGYDLQGHERALAALKGQWLLVSVQPAACPSRCQEHLQLLHQLRETLGKDKDRVDAVWLVPQTEQTVVPISWAHDFQILRVPLDGLRAWLAQPSDEALDAWVFVVDPLGNAMARFPAHFDSAEARKMRRVLERLLRASVAWDGPGR